MPKAAKKVDATIQRILKALESRYGVHHPKAKIEAYRYNPASIRIRIIDPDFAHKGLVEREEMVWPILEELPEDILSQLTLLLLITPKERKRSFGSMEFDNPTPWVPLDQR